MISFSRPLSIAAAVCILGSWTPRLGAADDVLARARAMYGALTSYADTGLVTNEYGTSSTAQFKFVTRFNRSPRRFYLESAGGEYVIWGDPDAFHTWTRLTGGQYDYPNPNNAPAISQSAVQTRGVSGKVPTLLFSKAALGGIFDTFVNPVNEGIEMVSGHRCHRIAGSTHDVYGATGRETNVHKLVVWIDADSLLLRKVLEEWQPLPGQRSRVTTNYEPQANPSLDDSLLRFTPPRPK